MSEKDIKIKPQTTTKAVKNAPKSVEHSAKNKTAIGIFTMLFAAFSFCNR